MQLYYRALAIVIALLLGAGGMIWILHKTQGEANAWLILSSWLLFLLGIVINTTNGMWHPLLSGINRVRLSQQILVIGLVINYAILLAGLLLGWGLLAPVAGYLLMGIVSRTISRAKFIRISQLKKYYSTAQWSPKLLKRLWPTAWRTGVVTLGIYITLNLGTLICSYYLGLKATASYGLSLQLVLAAIAIATSFVAVKIPLVAQMHALGKASEIGRVVFPRMRWFWGVYAGLALVAVCFGDRVLRDLFHSRTELLSTPLLIALFVVVGLEGHHAVFRDFAVASHHNPFAKPVIISSALIAILSFLLVPRLGLWALILIPGVIQICFNNWWIVLVGLRSMGSTTRDYVRGLFGRQIGVPTGAP